MVREPHKKIDGVKDEVSDVKTSVAITHTKLDSLTKAVWVTLGAILAAAGTLIGVAVW